uniref:Reverse transcriptase zinc-binding domain-containing protein n=1 Tax=Aegilops tauschii subsp. strangulata TaxID=200361 RepID=A0A453A0P5_AEGTS
MLTKTGRITLINAVLTSITTYYLTMFAPSKWLIKRIDKLRRGFLWRGEDEAAGSHCAVNWKQVCSPTRFGGLGIKNLELFSRSLRLRWLWNSWTSPSRPWISSQMPCSATDLALFNTATSITLGNKRSTKFWSSSWLNGSAPKNIAHNLYKLVRRKNASVAAALANGNWMRRLQRLTTTTDLHCFFSLWQHIQQVNLTDEPDAICWKTSSSNHYSASSAYDLQFLGSINRPALDKIWHIKSEGKVKFFTWLLAQNRLPPTYRLRARRCDIADRCSLCDQTAETAARLFCHFPFTSEVCFKLHCTLQPSQNAAASFNNMHFLTAQDWWAHHSNGPKQNAQQVMYFAWNIWNERNRRVFKHISSTADEIVSLIASDLNHLRVALCRPPPEPD